MSIWINGIYGEEVLTLLRPPDGYRYVLFISFDLDAESAEIYRGSDPNTLSRGRFSVYRGVYKLLDLLEKYEVHVTFFTPSWVVDRYPTLIEEIVSRGHEIAAHGYLHERLDQLGLEDEENVFKKTSEIFKDVVGQKPLGFRSPYWRWSKNTVDLLLKYGYRYDSSLMDDEVPYILKHHDGHLYEYPVDWRLDDWPYLEYYRSLTPRQLLEQWLEEIRYAENNTGYVSITMHPQCIGRGARIKVLEKLLEHARRTGAWIPRGKDLADYLEKLSEDREVIVHQYVEY